MHKKDSNCSNDAKDGGHHKGEGSVNRIPFLELSLNDKNGCLFAIGWTGSWKARFANTGQAVDVEIGMEQTNFRLMPGESIRQPSITVFVRTDQPRREFTTLVHRFMLDNKVPRDSHGNIIPPILAVASGGGNKTPQMMDSGYDLRDYREAWHRRLPPRLQHGPRPRVARAGCGRSRRDRRGEAYRRDVQVPG